MSKKNNFYAVKKGRKTGIFTTWKECQAQVAGFSGPVFRGFVTREEAEAFLAEPEWGSEVPEEAKGGEGDIIAFVDGSYEHSKRTYAYGAVLLTPDGEEVEISGRGEDESAAALRNVAGEMLGATKAVEWAIGHGYTSIEIRYDYQGIELWATGGWRAKNAYTQAYARQMKEAAQKIAISFHKVKAHAGVHFNERADQLAKGAIG